MIKPKINVNSYLLVTHLYNIGYRNWGSLRRRLYSTRRTANAFGGGTPVGRVGAPENTPKHEDASGCHLMGAGAYRGPELGLGVPRCHVLGARAHSQASLDCAISDGYAHPFNWSTMSVAKVMADAGPNRAA